jgi:hypothetical protein
MKKKKTAGRKEILRVGKEKFIRHIYEGLCMAKMR